MSDRILALSVPGRPLPVLGGILMASLSIPFLVSDASGWVEPAWVSWLLAGLNSLILFAGGFFVRGPHPRAGRVMATLGLAILSLLLIPILTGSPVFTLLIMSAMIFCGHLLWTRTSWITSPASGDTTAPAVVRGACLSAVLLWLLVSLTPGDADVRILVWLAPSFLVIVGSVSGWLARNLRRHPIRCFLVAGSLIAALASVVLFWGHWWLAINLAVVAPLLIALVMPWGRGGELSFASYWWGPILGHPERLLATTFFLLCAVGTVWLALPVASASGQGIRLVDAAFTAVSAVCVTGLIVLDTPVDFSFLGQAVILLLIQLGGLGIMVFSTVAIQLFGKRMSLRHESALAGLVSVHDRGKLFHVSRKILFLTLAFEGVGAGTLLVRFLAHGDSFGFALWRACFTAVSAFCNAGFSLQSTSLISYQGDPWVLHTVAILIIAGGLSPLVVLALPRFFSGSSRPVTAQTKLVLSTTAALLVTGFVLVLTLEWSHSLRAFDFMDRIHQAWFQSVTLRTAGFNSIDLSDLRAGTLTTMLIFMFIGGSPGGTAGGIKTTTVAILLLSVVAAVRGRWMIVAYRRSIPHSTLYKAAAILTAGVSAVLLALFVAQTTQTMPGPVAVFEVVSALGTVGLSIGGTSMLDGVGKALIIVCMFAGRVGPLTLFMFLSQRRQRTVWERPYEDIDVG